MKNQKLNKKHLIAIGVVTLTAAISVGVLMLIPKSKPMTAEGEYISNITTKMRNDTINSLVATDALGRHFDETNVTASNRKVGIFYHVWHGYHTPYKTPNITELLSENPELLFDKTADIYSDSPSESSSNPMHYWAEPLYGYYASSDPWVVERHIELFTMSSIDYLAIDLTNLLLYGGGEESYGMPYNGLDLLFNKLLELHDQGWNVPKVIPYFGINDNCVTNAKKYYDYYANSTYEPVFYKDALTNKPILSITKNTHNMLYLNSKVKSYFTIRDSLWPTDSSMTPGASLSNDSMPWIDFTYPQRPSTLSSGGQYLTVSVAQHPSLAFSSSYNHPSNMNYRDYNGNRGRGWSYSKNTNIASDVRRGANLEHQWATAFDNYDSIMEVMVTGWNEWIASKTTTYGSGYADNVCFVDQFNEEFSRDMEMTKGLYGDNFYLQNMRNTRAFKSNASYKNISNSGTKTLNNLDMWTDGRIYVDFEGDALERSGDIFTNYMNLYPDNTSVTKISYSNHTNRNDISNIQVINDSDYLYFRVNCVDNINIADRNINFLAYLSIKNSNEKSWNGYNYVLDIGNTNFGSSTTNIKKFSNNNTFSLVNYSSVDSFLSGQVYICKIPLSKLGIKDSTTFTIDFKVSDGVTNPGDIMQYYIDGDSAPIGRLNYRYNGGK